MDLEPTEASVADAEAHEDSELATSDCPAVSGREDVRLAHEEFENAGTSSPSQCDVKRLALLEKPAPDLDDSKSPEAADSTNNEKPNVPELGSRYRLQVALLFADRFLSLLNVRELTTDLSDDIRAATVALERALSLLRPEDRQSRLQKFASVLVTERGAVKLTSRLVTQRPVLCTGLATWLGIATAVLARSYPADFGRAFVFPEAAASTEIAIQGVLQQNYDLRLEQASQALTDDRLLPEAPTTGIVQHEIQAGETLWHLTKMYQLDAAAIATSNGINAETSLEPGNTLFIPRTEGLVYTVGTGETLETIASSHEVSETDIIAATPLREGEELDVGQRLVIPGKVEDILAVRNKVLETLAASGVSEWDLTTYTTLTSDNGTASDPEEVSPRTYIVSEGDTLADISRQFNTSTRELLAANPDVRSTRLQLGVTLTIPESSGDVESSEPSQPQTYQVQGGDTLESIANRHNLTVNEIIRANPTVRPNRLQIGQRISIPGGAGESVAARPPAVSSSGFIWPVSGRVNSGFGWRWGRMHNGIDIPGPYGTPIVAAQGGTVIFSGWHTGGYGNMVKIQHPNGLVTLYAHGTSVFVRNGQAVQQGQPIMSRGSTGWSTGPHLHLEVHVNGVPVNPMRYFQ